MQFTAEDLGFVVSVLGRGGGEERCRALTELFCDVGSRDLLLDDPGLYRALLERPACLRVSSHFYFYVMVRHTLLKAGLEDRGVADYVAEVLSEFAAAERHVCELRAGERPLEYFFELVEALRRADERMRFMLAAHIGNLALVLTGLFHERVRHRASRRGFPDIGYYAQLGGAHFRLASDHRLARRYDLDAILKLLADHFESARQALNDMADRLLCFETVPVPALLTRAGG